MTIRLDLLQIYGRVYIMQHCIAYITQKMDERRYRAYITDALMVIAENTARFAGGQTMAGRWYDAYMPVDTRTGDEIVLDILEKTGLRAEGGEQRSESVRSQGGAGP